MSLICGGGSKLAGNSLLVRETRPSLRTYSRLLTMACATRTCSCYLYTIVSKFAICKLTLAHLDTLGLSCTPNQLMRSHYFSFSLIWATRKSKFLSVLFLVISTRVRVASSSELRISTAHPFDCLKSDCFTYYAGFIYAASLCALLALNCLNRT